MTTKRRHRQGYKDRYEGETYLSVEAVAKRFGVNSTTVYRLAHQGFLPGFKIGNQWRFSEEMLKAWVVDRMTISRLQQADEHEKKS